MYCYAGIAQFGEEKCGDAIRSLNEAKASTCVRKIVTTAHLLLLQPCFTSPSLST